MGRLNALCERGPPSDRPEPTAATKKIQHFFARRAENTYGKGAPARVFAKYNR